MNTQTRWPARRVRLVLCTGDDGVLGVLPEYDVDDPDWREAHAIVEGCRARHGFAPTVLRLIASLRHQPPFGGPTTYLAEVNRIPDMRLEPWRGPDPLADHPLRLAYARPGGPAAEVAWARDRLADAGIAMTGYPVQVRTWNLSSIWRLPTGAGDVWLKSTPPFCAHEGAVMSRLPAGVTPPVLAFQTGRVLLGDVEGVDQYDAGDTSLLEMIGQLVLLQAAWSDRAEELVSLGVRDRRPGALRPEAQAVFERYARHLDPEERRSIALLIDRLDAGFAEVASCGMPDTLVHGDFHSGNVRGKPGAFAFLDWGDSAVGHPLIDELAFCERRAPEQVVTLRAAWHDAWSRLLPGADPERAATLLSPLISLSGAVIYQTFLDGIEPDERVYHEDDPLNSLRWAAKVVSRTT
jgi:hypothetical protein